MEQLYATACAKSLRVSPTKVRLLADLVRGKKVGQAIAILNNCQSPVKVDLLKVLNSAIANAVPITINLINHYFFLHRPQYTSTYQKNQHDIITISFMKK